MTTKTKSVYVKLHVSLPPDVLRALKVRAATDGLPMSKWVTRLLRAQFGKGGR